MFRCLIPTALILVASVSHQGSASRILGIFPTPSFSHQVVFRGLTMALRDRGHELVVITTDPVNDPTLQNYTEIDVNFLYENFNADVDWIATRKKGTWFELIYNLVPRLVVITEQIFNLPEVKKLCSTNSGEKFDLLMIEMLYWPAFLPLAERFDVPVIGMTSFGLPFQMQYGIGNPIMPSHPAHWDAEIKELGRLSLWQRLQNFVHAWRFLHFYRTDYLPRQQAIAEKYFGSGIPDVADLERNVSLVFVNQQAPISFVKPNIPKIIDIGGFHVSKQIDPLSQHLQRILDNATQGFIYMSLGSNVKSVMLSMETRGEFLAAFSKLPYTVIWKFEDDILPGQPDNVIITKWAPQQSILAHPNIKAFIYQGGLQSTEETISHGVPVIGLPVFADQDTQVNKMVSLGVGTKLEILTVNRMELLKAIQSVVLDGSYKQRMLKLRDLIRDKPYDSLENAVWWTEHVIRHKGAPHLHSTTADDPWYQQQDMDLIFLISTAVWTALIVTLFVLYKLLLHSIHVLKYQLLVSKKKKKQSSPGDTTKRRLIAASYLYSNLLLSTIGVDTVEPYEYCLTLPRRLLGGKIIEFSQGVVTRSLPPQSHADRRMPFCWIRRDNRRLPASKRQSARCAVVILDVCTKMSRILIMAALILCTSVFHHVFSSRILGIFPFPSISHQIVYRGLTLALRERGHELVVITTDPIKDPGLKNYTEIDIHFLYDGFNKDIDWIAIRKKESWLELVQRVMSRFNSMTEHVLSIPEVKQLYSPNSGLKFDLLMIEMLYWPAILPLAERLGVPVVGVASFGLPIHLQYGIGNPIMPSHPAHWDSKIKVFGKSSLWERLQNFVDAWRFVHYYRTDYLSRQQAIAREYFGSDVPDVADIEKNVSVIFVNQQAPISFVRPNIPKIIDIGGFHISETVKPLSKNLRKILNDATQGFIYMSLGTNVKSIMMSNELRKEFIAAFSLLPYTVIWKFEGDTLPGRPDNVIIMKWAPQQSILAHPNLKVFIYQGGLQSTEEAISQAAPVIGLPVYSDQDTHVNKLVSLGVGKKLEILTVNRMDLVEAIQSIVLDSSYKKRMLELRDLLKDKPHDSLENAVWWTEHVIRHKGAPHLHSTTADDPWYQRQDMDLIFIISTAIWTAVIIILVLLYKVLVNSVCFLSRNQLSVGKKEKLY
ncbi:uncharacterized protein LOC124414461 [Diprion similis]|uniref:uncharacterized protein LOC124414461 n=1 Tax=Diprion similis TaxID=362088 RepID=UPI001EF788BF|nr:uncharacterized protein LOC124414461 [Diprion similis]